MYSSTKYGEIDIVLIEVRLAARETTQIELPLADLRLPAGGLQYSANLTLFATPRKEDGETLVASKLSVYYHPRDGGIVFYDDATRLAEFDSGALTEDARARSAEVEALDRDDHVVNVYTGEWRIGTPRRDVEQEEP